MKDTGNTTAPRRWRIVRLFCTLACVLTVGALVRGLFTIDHLACDVGRSTVRVETGLGQFVVAKRTSSDEASWLDTPHPGASYWKQYRVPFLGQVTWTEGQASGTRSGPTTFVSEWRVGMFQVSIALIAASVPMVHLFFIECRSRRDRRRVLAGIEGRCSNCGYDLRETAHRCPECGRAIGMTPEQSLAEGERKRYVATSRTEEPS